MRSELWFILTFLAAFGSVPAFNYFTDPLELYGDAKSQFSLDPNISMSRRLQLMDLKTRAGSLMKPIVILGTSHVGMGIDTCDSNIGKLWLPAMRSYEAIELLSKLVVDPKNERLIILDMAVMSENDFYSEQDMPLWDTLFNLEIAQWSLLKLLGLHQELDSVGCEVNDIATIDPTVIPKWILDSFPSALSNVEVGITKIMEACQNSKVRVATVLFPFYVSSDMLQSTKGMSEFLDGSQFISPSFSEDGCQIQIINLGFRDFQTRVATDTLGMDKDDWYDFNHFRPEAGSSFLATILSEMKQDL